MSRRRFLRRCLQGASLPWLGTLAAGATEREFHVLMVTFRGETEVDQGFREQLAQAGLRVRYTVRDVQQDLGRMPAILREARALRPDLIYTWGTPVTLALVGAWDDPEPGRFIRDIPVVFALVAAPQRSRIVRNLQAPGGNVTGAVHVVPFDVQLRVMQRYRPLQKLGVLYNGAETNSRVIVEDARAVCQAQGLELVAHTFHSDSLGQPVAEGVEQLIAQIRAEGAEWLYLLPDTFLGSLYQRVIPAALQLRLPCFGAAELAVRAGGALVGLVSRYHSVGQLAGAKAVDILAGGKAPGQLPVETLQRFSLLVNMRVAHSLRMYPPIDMLNYAEVIAMGDAPGAGA